MMPNLSDHTRAMLEMGAAMLLSGTLGLFVVESGQDANNAVFFRCLFGAIFLALFCVARGFFANNGFSRKTLMMTVAGGISLVINWVLLFSSYQMAPISIATAVYHTQPFFLLLIGAVILREVISGDKIFWVAVAFIGILLTINVDWHSASVQLEYLFGLCLAVSAAIFYAITTMIAKQLKGMRPHLIALIQVTIGVALLFPFADFTSLMAIDYPQWGYLIGLGGIHTCLLYILMYSAFQKLPTPAIAVMSFIYPAAAIIVDYIFYDQSLAASQFLGIALIMFASFAVNQNWANPLRWSLGFIREN